MANTIIKQDILKPSRKAYLSEEYLRKLSRSLELAIEALADLEDALLDDNKAFTPVSLADGDANNNSVYYSTTQSKLVYKDGSGTVNDLY